MEERVQIDRGNSNTFGLEDEAAKSDNSTIKDETPLIQGTFDDVTSKSQHSNQESEEGPEEPQKPNEKSEKQDSSEEKEPTLQ